MNGNNATLSIVVIVIIAALGIGGFLLFSGTTESNEKAKTSKIIQTSDADIRKQAEKIAIERYNSTHSGWRWFTRNTWGRSEYNAILADVILELTPEQAEVASGNFFEKYGKLVLFGCIAVVIIIITIVIFRVNSRSNTVNRVPIPSAHTTPPPIPAALPRKNITDVTQFDVDYERVLQKQAKRLNTSPEVLLAEHDGNVREAAQDAMQRV